MGFPNHNIWLLIICRVEGVEKFKYLGRPPDQTDNDWKAVLRNSKRAWSVWGRLGKMLRREGVDPYAAEMLYREVIQVALLFGLDNWVLSEAMERMVEGKHTRFLRQTTGNQARHNADGTRSTPATEEVQEAAGTQLSTTYIGIRQGTVAQWVVMSPVFELCVRDTGYEGGERRSDERWCQEALETRLSETLEEIFWESRRRRRGERNTQ